MLDVYLLHVGFEISLAYRCLEGYARRDPRIDAEVRFFRRELRMEQFMATGLRVNDFAPFSESERALAELRERRPAVLGVSCYIWNSTAMLTFCQRAKALVPDLLVVAGGPDVGNRPEDVLQRWPAVDVVVQGEAEETFAELLRLMLDGRRDALAGLAGTTTRGEDGALVRGPWRPPLENLDLIPSPYDDELDREDPALSRYDRSVVYETLRGCVFDCAFCLYGQTRHRKFDDQRVIRDLSRLVSAGYDVQVVDPIFGLNKKRTKVILEALAALEAPGGLRIESYAELLDRETAELYKRANVKQIGLGLQTIEEESLQEMDRRFKLERFQENLAHLDDLELEYYVDVIYGLPKSDYQGFRRTIDFVLGSFPHADIEIYRLLALPGTRYHAEADKYGLAFSPEPPYETYGCETFSYEDIMRAHRVAHVYKMLRGGLRQVWRLSAVWKRHYDGSAVAFLEDFADWLEQSRVLDFLSTHALTETSFLLNSKLAEFLEARGYARVEDEPSSGAPTPPEPADRRSQPGVIA
ncbi:MAG: DUF4080 domain-containing protein [Deltaproteobacteria bacterium]|nr:DUF4080 domain-containing protein [Deltaproteobacteria bacterium]